MSSTSPSRAEALARRYFQTVISGDAEALAALYAPEGFIALPNGVRITGPAAIREFYIGLFAHGGLTPKPVNFLSDDRRCVAELVAVTPDGRAQLAADFFTLDENGRVLSLVAYMRTETSA